MSRWKLEIFKTEDFEEACDTVRVLHARGYSKVEFSDIIDKYQYKTYTKIDILKKETVEIYCVEFMSYGAK